MNVVETCT